MKDCFCNFRNESRFFFIIPKVVKRTTYHHYLIQRQIVSQLKTYFICDPRPLYRLICTYVLNLQCSRRKKSIINKYNGNNIQSVVTIMTKQRMPRRKTIINE